MKKIIALVLLSAISLTLLAGCSKKEPAPAYDVKEILTKVEAVAPIDMPGAVDEDYIKAVLGLDTADIKNYAGTYAMATNESCDRIYVIEAVDGKADTVKQALEKKRTEIGKTYELYSPEQTAKANAGRIVSSGNYIIMVIAGDNKIVTDEGAEKAYEPIDKVLDEVFK